ncbi:MAG: transcription termination/antitermination factor NusG [Planctomycetes bacterium]|nr:transcription termination/antitermination factor NusG [Planctomycetota bacterium]
MSNENGGEPESLPVETDSSTNANASGAESVHESSAPASGAVSSKSSKAPPAPAPESPEMPPKKWYILKVAFNREDTIRKALEKRVKLAGVEAYFGDVLIPTEDVATFTRTGQRRVVKRKLYPGYLMIEMSVTEDTWFLVRETDGIGDFTGSGGRPTPMDDKEVERILKVARPQAEEGQSLKTAIPYGRGDRVRVKEGYFQNLEGEVDKVDEANGRVTVIISIFGRSTPVELDHWQVEPA